jgi:hypothetical protein
VRYALRTTFELQSGRPENAGEVGRADRILEWLYENLPASATLGTDAAWPPQWQGNRYTEPVVLFDLITYYRNVFAATADRFRILAAVRAMPAELLPLDLRPADDRDSWLRFEVRRVYGLAELLNLGDPTKKTSHPC